LGTVDNEYGLGRRACERWGTSAELTLRGRLADPRLAAAEGPVRWPRPGAGAADRDSRHDGPLVCSGQRLHSLATVATAR